MIRTSNLDKTYPLTYIKAISDTEVFMTDIEKRGLDSNAVKLIAIAAMTLDHIAWALWPDYPHELLPLLMHLIGRITCPIMCFFIAEGYHYTRDVNKYTFRLFAFALVSHFCYIFFSNDFVDWHSFIPFYYGQALNQTSVMWPLAWGLVMLRAANSQRLPRKAVPLIIILICLVTFPSDWSCIASLCVLAFGTNRGDLKKQSFWLVFYVALYAVVYFFAIDKVYGILQMGVVLAIPVIKMYNGRRGKSPRVNRFMKWLFYIYYPLHLLIIGLVK